MAVAPYALVLAGQAAEVGCSRVAGDSSFLEATNGGSVVAAVGQGGVAGVVRVAHDVHLSQHASLFQVAVRDPSGRVVGRDKVGLDIGRERLTPDVSLPISVEVDASHAHLGRISGPQ